MAADGAGERSALEIEGGIRIPLREIRFEFTRSAGPGGQNVNKVNSRAVLRWPVESSPSLPEDVRDRFRARFRRRIARGGVLIISSQRHRDQGRNVADCLEKLRGMIAEVAVAPVPRRPSRPGRAAKARRLDAKRSRSDVKRRRRRVVDPRGD